MATKFQNTVEEPLNMHEYICELLDDSNLKDRVPSNTKLSLARRKYCSKCNADEFAMYVLWCVNYDFDVLSGLVECVKYKDDVPAQIFLGKDGLLALAFKTGKLLALETGYYYTNPNLIVAKNIPGDCEGEDTWSKMVIPGKEKLPELRAWCKVYIRGLIKPITVDIASKEYNKYTDIWASKTETMTKKVALSQALSIAFAKELAGVYVKEEFDFNDATIEDKTDPRETVNKINDGVIIRPTGLTTEGKLPTMVEYHKDDAFESDVLNKLNTESTYNAYEVSIDKSEIVENKQDNGSSPLF